MSHSDLNSDYRLIPLRGSTWIDLSGGHCGTAAGENFPLPFANPTQYATPDGNWHPDGGHLEHPGSEKEGSCDPPPASRKASRRKWGKK